MNAVDTNVLVYVLDDAEPAKQAKARELIDRLVQPPVETLLPWQVAGELLSCLRKWESASRITVGDVEAHFRDMQSRMASRFVDLIWSSPSGRHRFGVQTGTMS